jgi:hypothetical protein
MCRTILHIHGTQLVIVSVKNEMQVGDMVVPRGESVLTPYRYPNMSIILSKQAFGTSNDIS